MFKTILIGLLFADVILVLLGLFVYWYESARRKRRETYSPMSILQAFELGDQNRALSLSSKALLLPSSVFFRDHRALAEQQFDEVGSILEILKRYLPDRPAVLDLWGKFENFKRFVTQFPLAQASEAELLNYERERNQFCRAAIGLAKATV